MRNLWLLMLVIGLHQSCSVEAQAPAPTTVEKSDYPVLVELFTSQGCSSCPPADALLKQLQATQQEQPIIALSYHVDYWNRLGWKDPYSQAAFSERQRSYARRLDGRVYTPQMVINGRSGHVGSRATEVRKAIQAAGTQVPVVNFTTSWQPEATEPTLSVSANGLSEDIYVHVALVEGEVENRVPRGENRGRTLSHRQVVRALNTQVLNAGATALSFMIDTSILATPEQAALVLFAQATDSWEVLGVTKLDIR